MDFMNSAPQSVSANASNGGTSTSTVQSVSANFLADRVGFFKYHIPYLPVEVSEQTLANIHVRLMDLRTYENMEESDLVALFFVKHDGYDTYMISVKLFNKNVPHAEWDFFTEEYAPKEINEIDAYRWFFKSAEEMLKAITTLPRA